MSKNKPSGKKPKRPRNKPKRGRSTNEPVRWLAWLKKLPLLAKPKAPTPPDRASLIAVLRDAEDHNLIDPDTLNMLEGALQVSAMQVRDIMVPRVAMVVIEEDASLNDFLPTVIRSGFSRFPVIDDKHEQVLGILLAKDLLAHFADGEDLPFEIKDLIRSPIFIPESKRLNVLLREFRTSRNHMAIVVDEYGGFAGLLSIEDIIEQIVGQIDDEHDYEEEELIRSHGNHHTVRAYTPIDEFNTYFDCNFPDDECETIGGLLLKEIGQVPDPGEVLDYGGFHFKVMRADRRRIRSLSVHRLAASEDPDSSTSSS